MFCTFTSAFPAVSVQYTIRLFFFGSSLISFFPGMLLRYCLSLLLLLVVVVAVVVVVGRACGSYGGGERGAQGSSGET